MSTIASILRCFKSSVKFFTWLFVSHLQLSGVEEHSADEENEAPNLSNQNVERKYYVERYDVVSLPFNLLAY